MEGLKPYEIYQIRDIQNNNWAFLSYKYALEHGLNISEYTLEYKGELPSYDLDVSKNLERIFTLFNITHPIGFNGHSLSVSDVVKFEDDYYYCDNCDWKKIDKKLFTKDKMCDII